mgnify:CR=1 FL=1
MSGLVVTNVTKQFPTRGEGLTVLRGVSLACELGENVAIPGPSGEEKAVAATKTYTTSLAAIAALSAFSFAELAARYPRSAGEALYVAVAFGNRSLAIVVGLLVVAEHGPWASPWRWS